MNAPYIYIIFNTEGSGQPATRYVTGFSGSDSTLILMTRIPLGGANALQTVGWAKLLVDGRYWEQAETEVQSIRSRVQNGRIDIVKVHKDYRNKQAIEEIMRKYTISDCIVDPQITSYASVLVLQGLGLQVTPNPDVFQKIRAIKDEHEIKQIQKAQEIALKAYDAVRDEIQVGVSESYIAAKLEFLMKQGGAERASFETIVASGVRSALPHARSTHKIIQETDAVIVDFGCVYQGYCSDYTRTVLMAQAPQKLHELYAVVQNAKQQATNIAVSGVQASAVDKTARDLIETAGYGEQFTHATGHGVGMEVHELPAVSSISETILQHGHVITIEPGIYVPTLGGIRLEDMVII